MIDQEAKNKLIKVLIKKISLMFGDFLNSPLSKDLLGSVEFAVVMVDREANETYIGATVTRGNLPDLFGQVMASLARASKEEADTKH